MHLFPQLLVDFSFFPLGIWVTREESKMKFLLAAIIVVATALCALLLKWRISTVGAILALVIFCLALPWLLRNIALLFGAFRGAQVYPLSVLLIGTAAIFVSDDLFLVFKVTFTIRVIQLLLLAVILIGLKHLNGQPFRQWVKPIGFANLLVWSLFVFAFVFNVPPFGITRNLGYAAWLIFNIALVLTIANEVNSDDKLFFVLRCYVLGFFLLALFGLAQFLTPLLGIPMPFTTQWWIPGLLARINGISYEPSYYATYMVSGWVLVDYLYYKRVELFQPRAVMKFMYWSLTAVVLVCSSRIGWMTIAAWSALRLFWWIREGNLRWKHAAVVGAVAGAALLAIILVGVDLSAILLRGIVASDSQEAFSLDARQQDVINTLQVAREHPIIGVSLGGVGPQIAHDTNQEFESYGDKIEGQSTSLEILAATGIFGLLTYLSYVACLLWKPLMATGNSELAAIVKGLGWSLTATFFSLQFNQNVLRLILWFHIALLSAAYAILVSRRLGSPSAPAVGLES